MQLVVGILVIVLVLYYFASHGDVRVQKQSKDIEDELLHLCLGDREQAERLLKLELKKASGIDRDEAARRAIRSLKRDMK